MFQWGQCECNAGTTRFLGRCQASWATTPVRPPSFDPFQPCASSASCMGLDMNLVCNTELVVGSGPGRCQCRPGMRWNQQAGECQIYLGSHLEY